MYIRWSVFKQQTNKQTNEPLIPLNINPISPMTKEPASEKYPSGHRKSFGKCKTANINPNIGWTD